MAELIPGLEFIYTWMNWLVPMIFVTGFIFISAVMIWKYKLYRRWPFRKWPVHFHYFEKRAEGGITPKRDKYRTVREKDGSEFGELLHLDIKVPPISYSDIIQDAKGGLHFFCQRLEHDLFIPVKIILGEKNPINTKMFLTNQSANDYIKDKKDWTVYKIKERLFVPIKVGFDKVTPEFQSDLRDMKLATTMKSIGHRQVRIEYAKPSFFEKWGQHLFILAFAVGASLFFYFLLTYGFIPALSQISYMLDRSIQMYEGAATATGSPLPVQPVPVT